MVACIHATMHVSTIIYACMYTYNYVCIVDEGVGGSLVVTFTAIRRSEFQTPARAEIWIKISASCTSQDMKEKLAIVSKLIYRAVKSCQKTHLCNRSRQHRLTVYT